MTVEEAFECLQNLIDQGYGDAEIISIDTRSGMSDEVSISSNIKVHEYSNIDAGILCDMDEGTIYVPIYLG